MIIFIQAASNWIAGILCWSDSENRWTAFLYIVDRSSNYVASGCTQAKGL